MGAKSLFMAGPGGQRVEARRVDEDVKNGYLVLVDGVELGLVQPKIEKSYRYNSSGTSIIAARHRRCWAIASPMRLVRYDRLRDAVDELVRGIQS